MEKSDLPDHFWSFGLTFTLPPKIDVLKERLPMNTEKFPYNKFPSNMVRMIVHSAFGNELGPIVVGISPWTVGIGASAAKLHTFI